MNPVTLARAFAAGVESGRYLDLEDRPVPGPRFEDPSSQTEEPDLLPAQVWLDEVLWHQDKQR